VHEIDRRGIDVGDEELLTEDGLEVETPVTDVVEDADADALLRGRAAVPARFVACGVAAAAVCVVEIIVYDEFSSTLGGEGGVGKLSFVGFFVRPGWL
jgi:hypothetical protein